MEHFRKTDQTAAPLTAAHVPPRPPSAHRLAVHLTGPGGLYNIGNAIALSTSLTFSILETRGSSSLGEALLSYLPNNPAASWLTVSLVLFIVAGKYYRRAFIAETPRPDLVRIGDYVSALAGAALAVSLVHLGDVALAIVAGVLLGGGRLGSAPAPGGACRVTLPTARRGAISFDVFRVAVIASRAPTLVLLAIEIARAFTTAVPIGTATFPGIMFGCFLLWLRAGILLMRLEASPERAAP